MRSMNWSWLLLLNLAVAFYNVGMIWLAQLNWLLWAYIGPQTITAYRWAWWHGIWWAIFPMAALAVVGICAQLVWRPPVAHWTLWLAFGIQLAINIGTVFWWGASNVQLNVFLPNGHLDPSYTTLVNTHWIRVTLFSLAGLLELWIAFKSFRPLLSNKKSGTAC